MRSERPVRCLSMVAVIGVVCLLAAPSAAQAPPDDPADLRPGEIQRLFDAYLVMEAQRSLGLSDTQYPPFLTRLRALQEIRRKHLQARNQLLGELGRLTAPSAVTDEPAIRERLAALQALDARSSTETATAYAELDGVLDPRQQARFRVFENQIERRKLELMLRARQNARPGPRPVRPRPQ
jgi:hypothetical protein